MQKSILGLNVTTGESRFRFKARADEDAWIKSMTKQQADAIVKAQEDGQISHTEGSSSIKGRILE